jgi:dTDP-4-dehydrorhamnose 3,5-epimerase-like enzyme
MKEQDGWVISSTDDVEETVKVKEPEVLGVFRHVDDRGVLTQTFGDDFKSKRCYEIRDRVGVIRGMHGHKKESKLIYVSKGIVKFIIFPMNYQNRIVKKYDFTLSEHKPQALLIPTGYYHGFKSLKDSVIHFYSDSSLEESKNDDFREKVDESWFEVNPR